MIVVAAGVIERGGRFLLAQRGEGRHLAFKWEFPGGKLEPGEQPEEALERELREELGVCTRAGRILDAVATRDSGREILLLFYRAAILSGEPQPLDCRAVRWALPEELAQFDLAPADARAAAKLLGAE